ncbi:MAG TPA: DUF4956 domain-containing protein [Bacillota bacterium]|nr:DUF4956 domain-containing protein [Bacillota bacterium]
MDSLEGIFYGLDLTTKARVIDSFIAIILSFILTLIVTRVYKLTYRGRDYSQSFIHTVIIMGVVVSVIMIAIGNNIAVAFGLVGAFSIIRFRSAMSDPKDIAFIFFGMAAGILCGLGFYLIAIAFTITLSILIYVLYVTDYGKKTGADRLLRIKIPENLQYDGLFDDIFDELLSDRALMRVSTTNLGTMITLEYEIVMKENVSDQNLIDKIRERNANLNVQINYI